MRELFNGTKPYEIIIYVNQVTNGYFSPIFLLIIWVAIFSNIEQSPDRKFAAASFPVFFLALVLRWLDALLMTYFIISVVLLMLSVVFLYISRDRFGR